jgi:phage terminase small subunit
MDDSFIDEALTDIGLSEKEIIFCEQYAIYANAAKAARTAGYNNGAQSARQLLTKPEVQNCLKALRSKAAEMAGVTIVRNLMELAAIAYPSKGTDDDGKVIDVYQAKPSDRLKAIEVINKMCAFNAPDQVELSGKDGAAISITGMVIKKE